MATYYPVPKTVPLQSRISLITDVAVGDQVPIDEVLGRPANGIKLIVGDASDSVSYKLNTKFETVTHDDLLRDSVLEAETLESDTIWSQAPGHSEFTETGSTEHTIENVKISSIEITALTLVTGTTIQIMVW